MLITSVDIVISRANTGKKQRNSLFGGLLLLHGQKFLQTDSLPLGPLVHFGGKLDDTNTKLPLAETVEIGKVTLVQVGPEGLVCRTELGLRLSLSCRCNLLGRLFGGNQGMFSLGRFLGTTTIPASGGISIG